MELLSAIGGFIWGAFTASLNIIAGEFIVNASFLVIILGCAAIFTVISKLWSFFAGGKVIQNDEP